MFGLLLKWFLSFFTADKIGVLIRMIVFDAGSTILKDILNPENQKKALEFVKALNKNEDMTGAEKAMIFNKMMLEWAASVGKKLAISSINCLRELAVISLKS